MNKKAMLINLMGMTVMLSKYSNVMSCDDVKAITDFIGDLSQAIYDIDASIGVVVDNINGVIAVMKDGGIIKEFSMGDDSMFSLDINVIDKEITFDSMGDDDIILSMNKIFNDALSIY